MLREHLTTSPADESLMKEEPQLALAVASDIFLPLSRSSYAKDRAHTGMGGKYSRKTLVRDPEQDNDLRTGARPRPWTMSCPWSKTLAPDPELVYGCPEP
ncbi:unnamed protein product [Arctogadus glacialis]